MGFSLVFKNSKNPVEINGFMEKRKLGGKKILKTSTFRRSFFSGGIRTL